MSEIMIGDRAVGEGHPCYVIAEIGINHNGDVAVAKKLIDSAAFAGCDAVKLQKRTPELCTPPDQWDLERDTPWGRMRYIDYRHRVEFDQAQYEQIVGHATGCGLQWFASCWDEEAVAFIDSFGAPAYKVASASLTDLPLIKRTVETGKPVILSTGMSSAAEIESAAALLCDGRGAIMHATSTYPCPSAELNLRCIPALRKRYPHFPIGYSGHEVGLQTSVAAAVLGACMVERHITLDRSMWGSDQSASIEPQGLFRLVRDIRTTELALGDGVKRVYDSELGPRDKLRRVK